MRFFLILAAAGSGARLGAKGPKAFLPLGGRPLLLWSVETIAGIEGFAGVVAAVPPGHEERARTLLEPYEGTVVAGGARRQDSVREALRHVRPGIDLVAVHDAARPLVAAADVRATLEAAARTGGAIVARPVTDTLKRVAGRRIQGSADRSSLWRAETPQIFSPATLEEAYRRWPGGVATDEAELVEHAGSEVVVVPPSGWNPKVTYAADLELLERVFR